jgi:flagellar biosynthesis/type III secretory pathway protein FliH
MIESLRELYSTTIDTAHRDAYLMAYRIVEELIEQHLRESPEVIASWIKRAMEHLKQTSAMTLRYHPRYRDPLHHIATHLPGGITISMDESLAEIDFTIDTNVGTVSFSWRELLLSLKPKLPQEKRV